MDFSELDGVITRVSAARVVAELAPLITTERLERIERMVSTRLDRLHVAVERPRDPYNAAAIVRTAEALGALHVHVVGVEDEALHKRKTTQGSFNWLHTYHHDALGALLDSLRPTQARLCGARMDGVLTLEELPLDRPLCLLFGNEGTGLSDDALAACETTFRIPMYGMSESLNLSVSAAISLYSVATRMRSQLGRDGDMDGERLLLERARYYARCVDQRTLRAL